MKKIAICGSYAYDTIMNFNDKFKNHILPDKTHMLNVAFLVPDMRREFGGCAGNIAYNANLLGLDVVPVATVGGDFTPYLNWLEKCNIDTSFIRLIEDQYTGQAFITTDIDDNQITAFHPGAMGEAHTQNAMDTKCDIAIVSPDGKFGMIQHAKNFADNNVPFIFDPGQGLPMFNKAELLDFINQATWICVNDYEAEMLARTAELSIEDIAAKVKALIVTKGSKGCEIFADNTTIEVPGVTAREVLDPTGCGDSFRAGILYGIVHEWDWERTAKLANHIGSIKVASRGTQNHTLDEIKL